MKLNIKAKLMISFLVVVALTAIIGLLGINLGANTHQKVDDLANNRMPKTEGLHDLKIGLSDNRRYEVQAIFSAALNDSEAAQDYIGKYNKGTDELQKIIEVLFPKFKSDFAKNKIAEFNSAWKNYQDIHAKMFNLMNQGNIPGAVAVLRGESRDAYNKCVAILDELVKYNDEQTTQANTESEAAYKLERTKIIAILVAALIFSIVIGLYIAGAIAKPIGLLTVMAQKISDGDLTADAVQVKAKDETRVLAEAMNKMLENLKTMVKNIDTASQSVAATSEELASNAEEATKATQQVAQTIEQVAKGSTEQSKNVTETVQVMDQVAQAIQQIAAGAGEQSKNVASTTALVENMVKKIDVMAEGMETVKQVSEQNGVVATNGGQAVERTVKGMLQVKDAVFETAQKINELGEQ
ncbi:methyl-accepting chemotaxis protein, partial [Thermincola ferriacetica]